jgi:hypothetical protein
VARLAELPVKFTRRHAVWPRRDYSCSPAAARGSRTRLSASKALSAISR